MPSSSGLVDVAPTQRMVRAPDTRDDYLCVLAAATSDVLALAVRVRADYGDQSQRELSLIHI